MIASILLNKKYSIVPTKTGKFKVNETEMNIKDVPFVRYRFEQYTESEIEYIKKMKQVFEYSVHLVEIPLNQQIINNIEMVDTIEKVAKYVYIPVLEETILNGFNIETLGLLEYLKNYMMQTGKSIDRLMLRDMTKSLYLVIAETLRKDVAKASGMKISDIGFCSSPLSFGGQACLTAIKARELASKYTDRDDLPLPTANHECMNKCGCIRYLVVTDNIIMEDKKSAPKISKAASSSAKPKSKSKAKTGGWFRL